MSIELLPCRKCGNLPETIRVDGDLFYTQCSCDGWPQYLFIGINKYASARQWNEANSKDIPMPKKKVKAPKKPVE